MLFLIVYITLQNDNLPTKKSVELGMKNLKYNERRADNVESKFSRFLPNIRKRRDKKEVFIYI